MTLITIIPKPIHIDSKHKGIKYNCDQCDYKATEKRTLKMHIESKHIKSLQEGLGIIVISVIKEQHKEAH